MLSRNLFLVLFFPDRAAACELSNFSQLEIEVLDMRMWTYLKLLRLFCHALFNSTRIFTHLKIISSPPLKSMPSWTTSPSLTGNGFDSMLGWLSLMWLRNVPEELCTSLINHCPFSHQNSQCFRLTTFDLNPTGADEGAFAGGLGMISRSEYLPTLIISSSLGRVLEVGGNASDGLVERRS